MILLLTGASFIGAFGLFRFHDDWTFAYKAREALAKGESLSFILRPLDQHWSPLWQLTEVINARLVGWESDYFLRGFILLTFFASLALLLNFTRWLGVNAVSTCAALIVFGVHPISAVARYSFDCYSQCAADLLTWTAAVLLMAKILPFDGSNEIGKKSLWGFYGLLIIGLLFKEQALAGFATSAWFLAVAFFRFSKIRRASIFILTGLFLLAGAFTLIRFLAGVSTQMEGPFHISPLHAPINAIILVGGQVSPIPLLFWFDALRAQPREIGLLVLYALLSASVVTFLLAGLFFCWRHSPENRFHLVLVSGALILSGFPAALLAHVGELYAHTGLFWFATLVALATQGWRISFQEKSRERIIQAAVLVWGIVLAIGLRGLMAEMRATGERSRQWLTRSKELLAPLPAGSFVVVDAQEPAKLLVDYSLLRLSRPQYLILTGIRPWAFRLITNDKPTVVLREGVEKFASWRQQLADCQRQNLSYRLWIGNDEMSLHQCGDSGCNESN
ncbi:MAG: hypothetical protein JST85_23945 [Acidobacteria bacterium]|nr:hypothetical protein [Acidobacteriota bacterium]